MNKPAIYFSIAAAIIVSLLIGGVAGIFYQKQKDSVKVQSTASVVQSLSSKVVSAVVAYGQITNIDSNRNIILNYNGDNLTIAVSSDAQIYEYKNSVKKEVLFQDLKVGDLVNITALFSDNGQLEGNTVIIFSHSTAE